MATQESAVRPGSTSRGIPDVWGNVPQRNKNFTGRLALIQDLEKRIKTEVTAVLPHALQGLGGVGKTQLAVEYAYRYAKDYQLVWWIPADQPPLARSSLAALALRLGLAGAAPGKIEDAVAAVLEALRRGDPYERWLLIFDNADQPEEISRLMPHGPGHVLVTSRNHRWQSMADTVEVDVFDRTESLEFLSRRVPGIALTDANRLAEDLGDLPLALEQAGALQAETGMSVTDYLELLTNASNKLLSENLPAGYPVPVAAAWSLSVGRLREQMPLAMELLRLCAFFGPEPINRDLLERGGYVLEGSPLREALEDPIILGRAIRELGRYALARIDNNRKTLQVHRLIQKLIRDELSESEANRMRNQVHSLLVAADPKDPDRIDYRPAYEELRTHVGPASVVDSSRPEVRRMLCNIARYQYRIGDMRAAQETTDTALARWRTDATMQDRYVLKMSSNKAHLLWEVADYSAAYQLRTDLVNRMRAGVGEDDEDTLDNASGYGADLRIRGDFAAALDFDRDQLERCRGALGEDHSLSLRFANNLALDLELNGDYQAALDLDEATYQARLDTFGRDDHPDAVHSLNAIARDVRQLGDYYRARDLAEQAFGIYREVVRQRLLQDSHASVLLQAKDLSVARRMAGDFQGATELAHDVHQRYLKNFPKNHPDTLAAAINLGNALRRVGQFQEAAKIVDDTVHRYSDVLGESHPYTHACILNLAIIRRQLDDSAGAVALLEAALSALEGALGSSHHYTLTCKTSLATALASVGKADRARELGEQAFAELTSRLGPEHPHTLMCGINLALDRIATGADTRGRALADAALGTYRRVLGDEHPDVIEAVSGARVDFVFEPSPL